LLAEFRHADSLRRAVILMTVLGPCRALSPHRSEQDAS
jgi:hypothetical protein